MVSTPLTRVSQLALLAGSGWLLAALASCQPERAKEQPARPSAKTAVPSATAPLSAAEVPTQPLSDTTERQAATAAAADTLGCPPEPLRFSRLTTGPVFHRYTGTVGGERVTAELSWTHPDSITGRFYRWRGGAEFQLRYHGRRQGPVRLSVHYEDAGGEQHAGAWHLRQPPGPVLRGVWRDLAGRRHAFALREDYRQGARYDIQTLTLSDGKPARLNCYSSRLTRDYLHLRGTLSPGKQRLQTPALSARKRQLLAAFERNGDTSYYLSVRLNDFNLLSYQNFYELFSIGGGRHNGFENKLLDLATGRCISLASQFQPGYEPMLRRLLTNRLRRDFGQPSLPPDQPGAPQRLLDLPTPEDVSFSGLALTGAGLESSHLPEELYSVLGPEAKVYSIPYPILIPYRELRPLVRPGTPLARMLAARGLW
jgi:hypothetical protein